MRWLLLGTISLMAGACATGTGDLMTDCEGGNSFACSEWGHQLLGQGEKQQAENAFARACEKDSFDDCILQGSLMVERGELDGAEPPLLKAHDAESQSATLALADLYQARRAPGDEQRERQMRWEAPAIDKPDREFNFSWRPALNGGEPTYSLAYQFQPMEFWARRMTLGIHFAGNEQFREINASVGYQYFLMPEIVPYGTLLVGSAFQKSAFNIGAEAGVKWCLGPIGHLNLGAGVSVGSPPHATIGLGINSLPIELILLLAAH